MKQSLRTILIAILVMVSGATAMAKNDNGKKLSREELAVKQAKYIAHELTLDKSTADKYVKTYCLYQHEVWALGSRKGLTTGQRLERSQQILDLRKKYYKIYSGFLTEKQLDKAYKLEKRLLDRMGKTPKKHKKNNKKHR